MRKRNLTILAVLCVAGLLAWAPWITEDYVAYFERN